MIFQLLSTISEQLKTDKPTYFKEVYPIVTLERKRKGEDTLSQFPAARVVGEIEPKFLFNDADGNAAYFRIYREVETVDGERYSSKVTPRIDLYPIRFVMRFRIGSAEWNAYDILRKMRYYFEGFSFDLSGQTGIQKVEVHTETEDFNKFAIIDREYAGIEIPIDKFDWAMIDFILSVRYDANCADLELAAANLCCSS